jgi:xylulose-5-phosphate/fructose-6-phosphate phosphoketolase
MVVLNWLDRFHLVEMVIDRVPGKQAIRDRLIQHTHYVAEHGEDMPEISGWQWEH